MIIEIPDDDCTDAERLLGSIRNALLVETRIGRIEQHVVSNVAQCINGMAIMKKYFDGAVPSVDELVALTNKATEAERLADRAYQMGFAEATEPFDYILEAREAAALANMRRAPVRISCGPRELHILVAPEFRGKP